MFVSVIGPHDSVLTQRLLGMGANKAKIETLNKHLKYRACIYKNIQYVRLSDRIAHSISCMSTPPKQVQLIAGNVDQCLTTVGQ